jgi:hypothetical protein
MPDPEDFTAQLGRISGKLLSDNLIRQGIDLSFRNGSTDADLLYLEVTGKNVGINLDNPIYDLHVNGDTEALNLFVADNAQIGNLTFSNDHRIGTVLGGIDISMTGPDPVAIFDKLAFTEIYFNDNIIGSFGNQNITFSANGAGTIELQSNTDVTGDIVVSGNVFISGNLSKQGNLILGDDVIDNEGVLPENDTVNFSMPLSQSLIPGLDLGYDLGGSLGDSTAGRWGQVYSPGYSGIGTIIPNNAIISEQISIDSVFTEISTIQSNDTLIFAPDTDDLYVENLKITNNSITNLDGVDPLILQNTGIGYYRFTGTNGIVIPSGTDAERPVAPELGDTRWNTDQGHLECFDGSVYVIATGGGIEVTVPVMEEFGNVYTLILG